MLYIFKRRKLTLVNFVLEFKRNLLYSCVLLNFRKSSQRSLLPRAAKKQLTALPAFTSRLLLLPPASSNQLLPATMVQQPPATLQQLQPISMQQLTVWPACRRLLLASPPPEALSSPVSLSKVGIILTGTAFKGGHDSYSNNIKGWT